MQGFWGKVVLVAGTAWSLGWQATAAWSATGYLLVPKTQEVRRVDLETGKLAGTLNLPVGNVYHNAARADGQLLVAGDGSVSLIDAEGRLVEQIPLPAPVVSASFKKATPTSRCCRRAKRRRGGWWASTTARAPAPPTWASKVKK